LKDVRLTTIQGSEGDCCMSVPSVTSLSRLWKVRTKHWCVWFLEESISRGRKWNL